MRIIFVTFFLALFLTQASLGSENALSEIKWVEPSLTQSYFGIDFALTSENQGTVSVYLETLGAPQQKYVYPVSKISSVSATDSADSIVTVWAGEIMNSFRPGVLLIFSTATGFLLTAIAATPDYPFNVGFNASKFLISNSGQSPCVKLLSTLTALAIDTVQTSGEANGNKRIES